MKNSMCEFEEPNKSIHYRPMPSDYGFDQLLREYQNRSRREVKPSKEWARKVIQKLPGGKENPIYQFVFGQQVEETELRLIPWEVQELILIMFEVADFNKKLKGKPFEQEVLHRYLKYLDGISGYSGSSSSTPADDASTTENRLGSDCYLVIEGYSEGVIRGIIQQEQEPFVEGLLEHIYKLMFECNQQINPEKMYQVIGDLQFAESTLLLFTEHQESNIFTLFENLLSCRNQIIPERPRTIDDFNFHLENQGEPDKANEMVEQMYSYIRPSKRPKMPDKETRQQFIRDYNQYLLLSEKVRAQKESVSHYQSEVARLREFTQNRINRAEFEACVTNELKDFLIQKFDNLRANNVIELTPPERMPPYHNMAFAVHSLDNCHDHIHFHCHDSFNTIQQAQLIIALLCADFSSWTESIDANPVIEKTIDNLCKNLIDISGNSVLITPQLGRDDIISYYISNGTAAQKIWKDGYPSADRIYHFYLDFHNPDTFIVQKLIAPCELLRWECMCKSADHAQECIKDLLSCYENIHPTV